MIRILSNPKLLGGLSFSIIFLLSGCMSWQEGWKQVKKPAKEGHVSPLLARANQQIMQADNKENVLELIKTYESVLEIDPSNYEALWSLARYNILVGIAYTEDIDEKEKYYLNSVKYSEQAMCTNPEFKALVEKGEKVWNACRVLSKREIAALYYWYNGAGLISAECQSRLEQLLNWYWLLRYKKVMIRMMKMDPAWAGGHPYFAWAGYYASIPSMLGRDLKKAEEFFKKAEEAGPNWLYIKWSRAKLLHTKKKDKEAFKKDLQWVISQDPREADSPYPLNVYKNCC